MLTVKGKSSMQEGTFFSQAAALMEDLGLNIELGGRGSAWCLVLAEQTFFSQTPESRLHFATDTRIGVTSICYSGRSVDAQWTLQWTLSGRYSGRYKNAQFSDSL